ncbi:hypothetical protein I553_10236 [Mycobacterium xenopi 4042]|uniref:Zinc-ribbon domain-containing protein n=1 Tax=Mycobacterium xenopi 4042 TaxID=1299334 RepID=X8ANG0_MYCXE|nr:hypothetical protein I553_10236 [Mycobacterium xenopi 4042]
MITNGSQRGHAGTVSATEYQLCANMHLAECNWLVPVKEGGLCASCKLTRCRPNDSDTKALAAFARAERAKRRLIVELYELKLPIIGRDRDPTTGWRSTCSPAHTSR